MKLILVGLLAVSLWAQAPAPGPFVGNGSNSGGGPPTGAAGGDLSGTYPNPTLSTNVRLQSSNVSVLQSTAHIAEGDSITTTSCVGATANNQCYAARLAFDEGAALTNQGVSGQQAADLAETQAVFGVLSTQDGNPFYTMMIGTNDATFKGVGAYEAVYRLNHQAALAWLAVSSKVAANASNCTDTGTWAALTGYALVGEKSTTNGSTKSCIVTTFGGPLYAWYHLIDSDGGAFTYSVDGGSTTALTTATTPAIATQNSGTKGWGLIRVTGLSAGAHTILFTVTSATSGSNSVGIAAVGTSGPLPTRMSPKVWSAGVPRQKGDNASATMAAYNADALADVNLLAGDGLGIYFVDVRAYLCPVFSGGLCFNKLGVADMSGADSVHPNDVGYNDLKQAFENTEQFTVSSSLSVPFSVGTSSSPATAAGYSMFNSSNLQSTTALNQGFMLFNNAGTTFGNDLGYNTQTYRTGATTTAAAAQYINRMFAGYNQGLGLCTQTIATIPTAQSNFDCPIFIKNILGVNDGIHTNGPMYLYNGANATVVGLTMQGATVTTAWPNFNLNALASTTALNGGVCLFAPCTFGVDLGNSQGTFNARIYAAAGQGISFSFAGASAPTLQSSLTDAAYINGTDKLFQSFFGFKAALGAKYQTTQGTNGTSGVVTLTAGAATISTTAIAALAASGGAGDIVHLECANNPATTTITACATQPFVSAVTPGTSFAIGGTLTDTVYWEIRHIN